MLNHFSVGIGKEFIWLHGLLGNSLNLTSTARSIKGKHYFLDARNHGRSFHAKGMDYKTQAHDVLTLMNAQGIRKATVVGHSMGGKTAMALACLYPERIEKLCIMDIAPLSYMGIMEKYYGHIRDYLNFIKNTDIKGKTRKEIEAICQQSFEDIGIVHLISSNLKGSDKNFTWRVGIEYLVEGIDELGGWEDPDGKFEGPTVAIVGENSIHTTKSPLLENNQPLKSLYTRLFPNVQIEVLDNTGHFIHAESPSLTKAAIAKHFNT
ncbi:hypothetical protein SteCoe_25760 [Stentor coeruleus]|uniref:AB hydrolase-1 domain-containing protein n=1 Tax=Stentor coeruleus TaxID=5963 RepID=A0A1R2BEH6_9CILI|nr:hypothetical protein SteCoe_25760 [Stentor coeruleus]